MLFSVYSSLDSTVFRCYFYNNHTNNINYDIDGNFDNDDNDGLAEMNNQIHVYKSESNHNKLIKILPKCTLSHQK